MTKVTNKPTSVGLGIKKKEPVNGLITTAVEGELSPIVAGFSLKN